jgi:hypothetical protein
MKFRVFWDVAPSSYIEVGRRFRGAYCLHHQYTPLKRRSASTWLHGATSQKTLNFKMNTVYILMPNYLKYLLISSSYIFLGLPNCLSPSGFAKMMCAFLGLPRVLHDFPTYAWSLSQKLKSANYRAPHFTVFYSLFLFRYLTSNTSYHPAIVHRSRVVNTPASYLGGSWFKSRSGDRLSWLRFSRDFPQSLQANTVTKCKAVSLPQATRGR